jgi:hypothetical protein
MLIFKYIRDFNNCYNNMRDLVNFAQINEIILKINLLLYIGYYFSLVLHINNK